MLHHNPSQEVMVFTWHHYKSFINYFILISINSSTEWNTSELSNAIVQNTYFTENISDMDPSRWQYSFVFRRDKDPFTSQQPARSRLLQAAPAPYLSVDDHVWGALLRVRSFRAARVSRCLGHVCLSLLGLWGQEQKSEPPQAAGSTWKTRNEGTRTIWGNHTPDFSCSDTPPKRWDKPQPWGPSRKPTEGGWWGSGSTIPQPSALQDECRASSFAPFSSSHSQQAPGQPPGSTVL